MSGTQTVIPQIFGKSVERGYMAVYVIGDLHLSFSTSKPMELSGPRWRDHDKLIEQNWKNRIKESDTVIVPGDVSWGMTLDEAKADFDFIEALPGKKIFFKGNHDYYWQTNAKMEKFIKQNDYKTLTFMHNNAVEVEQFIICGTRGWYTDEKDNLADNTTNSKIVSREVVRLKMSVDCAKEIRDRVQNETGENKEIIGFLHFPAYFKDYICDELIDVFTDNGVKRVYYGHIHGNYTSAPKLTYRNVDFYLVSADYILFNPVKIE